MNLAWLSNYCHFFRRMRFESAYDVAGNLYGLMVLARGMNGVMDESKIIGDKLLERIARVVCFEIDRFADFTRLAPGNGCEEIVKAQKRLHGILGTGQERLGIGCALERQRYLSIFLRAQERNV